MKLNGSGLRRPDWQLLLAVYVERHRDTPFTWGQHDCALFALSWVQLVREDLDPATAALAERLTYTDARGALDFMDGRGLGQVVQEWGELTACDAAYAQRGDVVLVEISGRESLAVCTGAEACGPGASGLAFVPMTAARAAWRV